MPLKDYVVTEKLYLNKAGNIVKANDPSKLTLYRKPGDRMDRSVAIAHGVCEAGSGRLLPAEQVFKKKPIYQAAVAAPAPIPGTPEPEPTPTVTIDPTPTPEPTTPSAISVTFPTPTPRRKRQSGE